MVQRFISGNRIQPLRNSRARIFKFRAFFGPGFQVKLEGFDEGKSLKQGEVEI
jgi:hypothetical protein